MVEATDLITLSDGVWLWQAYDPATKADHCSTAVKSGERLYLVDPIRLAPAVLAELKTHGTANAVLVTKLKNKSAKRKCFILYNVLKKALSEFFSSGVASVMNAWPIFSYPAEQVE